MSASRCFAALARNAKAIALALLSASGTLATAGEARAQDAPSWCAPELESLSESVCYYSPTAATPASEARGGEADAGQKRRKPRTLVFFLHPLVGVQSNWQWDQQRLFARLGKRYSFSVLMPRARAERNSKSNAMMYTWPNSAKAQARDETEVLADWMQAKSTVEAREGRFDRMFIFGFSNGAYYATSLALRSRIEADGYGVFAGGEALNFLRPIAAKAERRAPIFVGYGTQDPMHHDQVELIEFLRVLGWPYRSRAANVGHMVTEEQLREALKFLGAIDEPAGH